MYEKIWDSHLVHQEPGQAALLYVDRHLMHEVTSPQAFEGLKLASRGVRNPRSILATLDHCVPTKNRNRPIADPIARKLVALYADSQALGDAMKGKHFTEVYDVDTVQPTPEWLGIYEEVCKEMEDMLGMALPTT